MDNDSNSSDGDGPPPAIHSKPHNRRSFTHQKLTIHSHFPTGNLAHVHCIHQDTTL